MKFLTCVLLLVGCLCIAGLSVNEVKGAPVINNMAPNPVPGKAIDQAVGIFGSGFVSGSALKVRVKWPTGQTDLQGSQVNFVSSTQLTIFINVGTSAANWTAQVINPDAQTSNVFSFSVTAAVPSISNISPNSYPGSNSNQTMTINGSNFVNGATLTFDPPTGSNINSTASKLTFVSTSQISYQFNNANDLGTWTVRVNNPGGQSSNTVSFSVTGAAATLPGAPQSLAAAEGNGQNFLAWNPPSSNGGAAITSYRVFRGTTSSNRQIVTTGGCANLGAVLSCTDTGLTNGQSYNYIVSAVNSVGQGPGSNAATATPTAPATLPSAPQNLSAFGGNGQNGLGWNPPSSNGGAAITSYRVFRGTTSANRQIVTTGGCANLGAVLSCTDTGLTNGQSYNYIVSAVNSAGQGPGSNAATATPVSSGPSISSMNPNPVPGKSVDQAVGVVGSGFVNGSGLKVRVSWPTGQTDLQGSQVTFNSSTQLTILINVGTSAANWTAQVINPNGQVSNVFAFSVTAAGPILNNVSPSSFPASTSNQTMTLNGSNFQNGATLTFDPPSGPNINSTASKLTFISSNQISYQFNNANDMGSWTVWVNNPNGQSSNSAAFTVSGSSLLQAPTLSAPSNGASGVSVTPSFSWSSVPGANRYWITVATSNANLPTDINATSCPTCVISCNVSTNSHTAPSCSPGPGFSATLSSNTTYYWRVQGYNTNANPIQQGQYSSVFSFTTKTTTSQTPTASFTFSPTSPTVSQSVQFSGSSTGASPITWKWDLNGDGITDSTSQNPVHVFQGAGTYRVKLTATNAYGTDDHTREIVISAGGSSGAPVVTRLVRQYPNFVRGNYDNRFQVYVDWKGAPGTLTFSIDGGLTFVENGTSEGGAHTFHMGTDFTPNFVAKVVSITPRNAAGVVGSPFLEYVYVYPYPAYFNDALQGNYGTLNFTANGSELRAIFHSDFPKPHLNDNGRIYIPSYIPGLGGNDFGFLETYTKQHLDISSTGARSTSVESQTGFTMAGRSFTVNGGGSASIDLSPPRGLTLTSASLKLSMYAEDKQDISLLEFLPGYGKVLADLRDVPGIGRTLTWFYNVSKAEGRVKVALDDFVARWSQDSAGHLRFSDGSGTVRFGADGYLRSQLSSRTYVQSNVWGEGSLKIGVPAPFTREVNLLIGIGSEVSIDYFFDVYFDSSKAYYKCTWLAGRSGADCNLGVSSLASSDQFSRQNFAGGSLSLIRPNYDRFGSYSVFRPKTEKVSFSSESAASAQRTTLVSNVFPGASPALLEVGNGKLLLWEHQEVGLPVLQSTNIAWSFNSGTGWSAPAIIVQDTRAELSPVAGVAASGKVVAAWIRVKDTAFSTPINSLNDLPLFYSRHEVVSSVFDPVTRTWDPIVQLTDDVASDSNLQLASDASGRMLLTWLSSADGQFTSTVTSPSTLKYAFWNGTSFSAPATLAGSLIGVSTHTSAVKGANAVVIVPRDPDPNSITDGVLDLYSWNGSSWAAASTFASGGVENRLPSIVYDGAGQGHVVWVQGGNLVHATLSDPTPQIVRSNSSSQAFYDARLLTNPTGNLTLMRQEIVNDGPANLFATLFDPVSQTWSEDRQLNTDAWMVHDVAGFYGKDGLLHASYLSTEIERKTESVLFNGQAEQVNNVPQNGQTNLSLIERSLIVDLAVADANLKATTQAPRAGEPLDISIDVHNTGDFAVSSFVVKLYSGSAGSGEVVASQTSSTPLRAGDHRVFTFSFNYPEGGANLSAVVDANNTLTEASESNNIATLYFNNTAPQANLTANLTSGAVSSTVVFDATGSFDAEGDSLSFAWAFADGSASVAGANVSHTFTQPGIYPVTVIVTDSRGASGMAVVNVTIGSVAQLSVPSINSRETDGSVQITITRDNVTSSASVDYSTHDGTATERSDYLAAVGTVRFGTGEASKTIEVFLVNDALGEASEAFTLTLSNPIGCSLGSSSTVTVAIESDEAVDALNPVKDTSFNTDFFVRQQYLDFFNRAADPGGLGFWKNQIDECELRPPSERQACREIRRVNVSAAFFVSIEFQETGYLVYKANQAAFNSGEFLKLHAFLPDTQEIGRGVVIGQAGAEAKLEANKVAFFNGFVQRPEFVAPGAYPTTMSAMQFVDKLNANTLDPRNPGAGVLTPAEREALVNLLAANPSSPSLRAEVLRSITQNSTFTARQFNKAFVLMQYYGYLRRNPNDAPETGLDFGGYNFWLGKLNQFNGNYIAAEMVKAFITAGEYQRRFGP